MTAAAGLNVLLVLLIGILMSGIIGIGMGTVTFFEWTMAIGTGMEDMFFLAVFSMLISGLIELIKYYGGLSWLFQAMTRKIRTRRSCEYLISLVCMAISGTTLNNPVAILITAPVARELGTRYRIAPRCLASLLDIFSCAILMLAPHDSGVLLAQQYGGATYLEIMRYSFYPVLLILFTCIGIQFGLLDRNEEKRRKEDRKMV